MERHGTKFMRDSQPCAFEQRAGGKIAVKVKNTVFGNEFETEFDTVILAAGRHAVTAGLNQALPVSESTQKWQDSALMR